LHLNQDNSKRALAQFDQAEAAGNFIRFSLNRNVALAHSIKTGNNRSWALAQIISAEARVNSNGFRLRCNFLE
jgi:hypothetical protein